MKSKKIFLIIILLITIIIAFMATYVILYYNGVIFKGNAEKTTRRILLSVQYYDEKDVYIGKISGFLIGKDTIVSLSPDTTNCNPYKISTKYHDKNYDLYIYAKNDITSLCIFKTKDGSLIDNKKDNLITPAVKPNKGDTLTIGYNDKNNYASYLYTYKKNAMIDNKCNVYICDDIDYKLCAKPVFDKYGRLVGISQNSGVVGDSVIIPYRDIMNLAR